MLTPAQYKFVSEVAWQMYRLSSNGIDPTKFVNIEVEYNTLINGTDADRDVLLKRLEDINQWFEDQIEGYLADVPDSWLQQSEIDIKESL